LFQTAFGSGAEPDFPPFAPDEDFAAKPLPDLAINLGRLVTRPVLGVEATPLVGVSLSLGFAGAVVAEPLVVRNVLLTLIDLKDFLTDEEVRPWPFSSSLSLDASPLDASLSEPPLTLTSVEFTKSSTISEMCLFSISSVTLAAASPLRCGSSESAFCESGVILIAGSGSEVKAASSDRPRRDSVAIIRLWE